MEALVFTHGVTRVIHFPGSLELLGTIHLLISASEEDKKFHPFCAAYSGFRTPKENIITD